MRLSLEGTENSKQNLKKRLQPVNQGPRGDSLTKKTAGRKSLYFHTIRDSPAFILIIVGLLREHIV
jgi:hypothetical protein